MTLRYDLDMADITAFYKHYLRTNENSKKVRKIRRFLIPGGLLAIMVIGIPGGKEINPVVFAGLLVFCVLWAIFMPMLYERLSLRNARKIYAKPENASFMGPQEMTFTDKGFEASDDGNKSVVRWNAVKKVYRTEEYFFMYMSTMHAYIIPLRRISADEAESLGELFKTHNLQETKKLQ